MPNQLRVLIVDDHPVIIDAYKRILLDMDSENDLRKDWKINTAICCDSALRQIELSNNKIDLAILDYRIPPSSDKRFLSGEDIAIYLKEHNPDCKILIITSYNDNYLINGILAKSNPDGLLIKSDVSHKAIRSAVNCILNGETFYSKSVVRLLRRQQNNKMQVDDLDKRILLEISSGVKTKYLPEVIPLSIGGIERRKRRLKAIFNVEDKRDHALIKTAKEHGYI